VSVLTRLAAMLEECFSSSVSAASASTSAWVRRVPARAATTRRSGHAFVSSNSSRCSSFRSPVGRTGNSRNAASAAPSSQSEPTSISTCAPIAYKRGKLRAHVKNACAVELRCRLLGPTMPVRAPTRDPHTQSGARVPDRRAGRSYARGIHARGGGVDRPHPAVRVSDCSSGCVR
jgi:hypothetical protein